MAGSSTNAIAGQFTKLRDNLTRTRYFIRTINWLATFVRKCSLLLGCWKSIVKEWSMVDQKINVSFVLGKFHQHCWRSFIFTNSSNFAPNRTVHLRQVWKVASNPQFTHHAQFKISSKCYCVLRFMPGSIQTEMVHHRPHEKTHLNPSCSIAKSSIKEHRGETISQEDKLQQTWVKKVFGHANWSLQVGICWKQSWADGLLWCFKVLWGYSKRVRLTWRVKNIKFESFISGRWCQNIWKCLKFFIDF